MQPEEIRRIIASFPRWHYQFDLKGNLTPTARECLVNRHNQRKRHIFDPLVKLAGGSLKGKRVLDLGCNAGFWSLQAVQNGCDFVLGIDGRPMHIDQANFVFETLEIEPSKYRFTVANVFDSDVNAFGEFDVVLCLGLMYHVSKPMTLIEKISSVNTDILVVDTRVSTASGSYLEIGHEPTEEWVNAVDYTLVMVPTRDAMIDLVREFGYAAVVLKPEFDDYNGAENYRDGTRKTFLCAKKTDLSATPAKIEYAALHGRETLPGRRREVRGLRRLYQRLFR